MTRRAPKVAGRGKTPTQVLFKRSGKIYEGMKARAEKVHLKMPFTLPEFRFWLEPQFDQDGVGRCEYSGELILAEDFLVDHRRPISRGGTFEIANLALCSEKQNLRKGNMNHVEYVALRDFVAMHLPPEVQDAIWKRLEVGDVQRFSYFRRKNKERV